MNHATEIATIIKKQLYTMDKNLMWGLGVSDFISHINEKNLPGLLFRTRGVKHKGWVEISLNEGMDLYEVTIFTIRSSVKKVKKYLDSVYAEDLPSILEENCY